MELEHKKQFYDKRRAIESKYGIGRKNTTSDLVKFVVDRDRAKKQREEKIKYRSDLKSEWEHNKEDIRVFEDKMNLVKNKTQFVKGVLIEYYTNLLRQGTDTRYFLTANYRGRGLIWIIQKLAKLGVTLDQSMLPQLLVPFSVEDYLEKIARLEKEITHLKKLYKTAKNSGAEDASRSLLGPSPFRVFDKRVGADAATVFFQNLFDKKANDYFVSYQTKYESVDCDLE